MNNVNCPNCGAKLGNPIQQYCEFCGIELVEINNNTKEEIKTRDHSTHSRRKCC